MTKLPNPRPTVAEVFEVWNSLEKPSVRRVAAALQAAGKKISASRVQQLKQSGWNKGELPHPLTAAGRQLDASAPLLTGDHRTKAADLALDNKVTPEAVTEQALKVLSGVLTQLERQAPTLIGQSAGQTGSLIKAIAEFHKAAVSTHREVQEQSPPVSATPEKSAEDPLKAALEAWRAGSESDLKALKQ
jgi:hypothetical protein